MKNNKIVMLFKHPSNELMDSCCCYLRKVVNLSDYEKIA